MCLICDIYDYSFFACIDSQTKYPTNAKNAHNAVICAPVPEGFSHKCKLSASPSPVKKIINAPITPNSAAPAINPEEISMAR